MDPRSHWQRIYGTKKATEVSWYQPIAELSLNMIRRVSPDPKAAVIDVGGGASTLVDGLLSDGYRAITVLDLSSAALAHSAGRLKDEAAKVTWLEADVLDAALPSAAYDVWHDRAVFHFLTRPGDRLRYVERVRAAVRPGGHVIVATFGLDGPMACSGLEVVRYGATELHDQFGSDFELLESTREEHHTPAGATQPFVYCLCRVAGSPGANPGGQSPIEGVSVPGRPGSSAACTHGPFAPVARGSAARGQGEPARPDCCRMRSCGPGYRPALRNP